MTREEIKQWIDDEFTLLAISDSYSLIDKIYDNFEQQIANMNSNIEAQEIMIADYKKRIEELEAPKSCEGCVYSPHAGYIDNASACLICSRFHLISDMYFRKDKQ